MAVGEGDAGAAADGSEVGVEGGHELFHAADGGLGDAEVAGEFGLGGLGCLPEGG